MKTVHALMLILGVMINTAIQAQENDDIYFNRKDRVYEDQQSQPSRTQTVPLDQYTGNRGDDYYTPNQTSSDTSYSNSGTTIINNNYYGDTYNNDDYYDYAYAARLRRFYNPVTTISYYDPYYTNMYWYNYDPYFYGTSIYSTYSWFYPGWSIRFGGGWGSSAYWNTGWNYGWGYNNWGWGHGYCGMPSYGYYGLSYYQPWGYYGYGGYGAGYAHGYNNGYYNGYYNGMYANNSYYNSYDANSYSYGHRGSTSSSSGRSERSRTLAEKYQLAYGQNAVNSRYVERTSVANIRGINNKPLQAVHSSRTMTGVSNKQVMPVSKEVSPVRNIHSTRDLQTKTPYAVNSGVPSAKPTRNMNEVHSSYSKPMPSRNMHEREYTSPRPQRNVNAMPQKVDRPAKQVFPNQPGAEPSRHQAQPRDYLSPRNYGGQEVKPQNTPRQPESRPMPQAVPNHGRQERPAREFSAPRQEAPRQQQYHAPTPKMDHGGGGHHGGGSRGGGGHSPAPTRGGRR